jgi:hypothetical protein
MFNKIAGDRMQIELFFADQLVPTGELFQAMQRGNNRRGAIGRRPMVSPTESFWWLFPVDHATHLDVPVLFNQYGLNLSGTRNILKSA